MLPLVRCRQAFVCRGCQAQIEKGTMALSLGLTWGHGSNGKCCLECIIATAENIRKEVIV